MYLPLDFRRSGTQMQPAHIIPERMLPATNESPDSQHASLTQQVVMLETGWLQKLNFRSGNHHLKGVAFNGITNNQRATNFGFR